MIEDSMLRETIESRLGYLMDHGPNLVLDGDVHPSNYEALPEELKTRLENEPGYFHGRPLASDQLVRTLDRARVDMAMCWHNPSTLQYGTDQDANADGLRRSNVAIARLADRYPNRVVPAGWTDPKALGVANAVSLARYCIEQLVMPVVKMNPAQNGYPIDDPMVLEVVDAIIDLGAVPAFHFGSDTPFTPAEGLRRIADRCGDRPVIAVHMGGGGGHFVAAEPYYQEARRLGIECPNIFFVLSAIRDPHIESALIEYAMAGEPFSSNLGIGSDAPYGNMSWNIGGFRALLDDLASPDYPDQRVAMRPELFSERVVAGFMGGNLARLLAGAYERMLSAEPSGRR